MKIEGGRRLFLGEYRKPTGGRRVRRKVPVRLPVVVDGVELEPVWFPHRDAASLIGDGASKGIDYSKERGTLNTPLPPWSWLG